MTPVNLLTPAFSKSDLRKNAFLFAWMGFFFFSGILSSSAQDVEIGRNIPDIEHKVIRLTVPFKQSNRQVMAKFFWSKSGQDYRLERWLPLREGRHAYEIRTHLGLKGSMPRVVLELDEAIISAGLKGEIVQPSLEDELDIFFKPQKVLPMTVHELEEHSLLGITWNVWVAIFFAVALILFCFLIRKPFFVALFLAFCVAWGAVDLRAMFDHWVIVQATQKEGYWVDADFSKIQTDLQETSKDIGQKTWALDESWDAEFPIYKPIIYYIFAESKFLPREREKDSAFLFSIKNGELRVRLKP